jgi:hypothetical protein
MKAERIAKEIAKWVPAMANNVLAVLLIQLLLGTGYILAKVFVTG